MNILMIVLRLIHIGSGVFWAGSAFFFVSFLLPAVRAAGPEGGKVMQRLALSNLSRGLASAGGLTVLSGLLIYWFDSGGLQVKWITTGPGLGFAFGGLMGLTSLGVAMAVTVPATRRFAEIAKGLIASGKPPSPEQMPEIQALQMKLTSGAIWNAMLLGLAVAAMAIARYL